MKQILLMGYGKINIRCGKGEHLARYEQVSDINAGGSSVPECIRGNTINTSQSITTVVIKCIMKTVLLKGQ